LPWLVDENHEIFNVYQQTQGKIVEKAMLRAKFVASFIGHEAGKAVFVGLYKVNDHKPLSFDQYWKELANVELKAKYGMVGMTDKHSTTLWFDLVPLAFRKEWKGKLIICWPGKEVSWWRWADRNEFRVHAITEDSILVRILGTGATTSRFNQRLRKISSTRSRIAKSSSQNASTTSRSAANRTEERFSSTPIANSILSSYVVSLLHPQKRGPKHGQQYW
jgi:hypothetical protein